MRLRTLGAVCATSAVAVPIPSLVSTASAQTPVPPLPPAQAAPPPPGDIHAGAVALLSNRHVRFERRYARLLGDPLSLAERKTIYAQLRELTPYKVRVETREVREDIRRLQRKLDRTARRKAARANGGAPDVAIPPQLASIAKCESGGNPRAISSGGTYRGKYQFSFSTWASVGGKGDPAAASETEQDRRAAILYRTGGPGHWPVCGR